MDLKEDFCFLIPARGGSKGIKYKNLRTLINKKNLTELAIEFAQNFTSNNNIYLNSDSKKILYFGYKMNVECIKRSNQLSGDRVSDIEILLYSIKKMSKKYKYVIYLQPTSPFRKKKDLANQISFIKKKNFDSIWSVSEVDKKFHPLKVLINQGENIKLFLQAGKKIIARQMLSDIFIRNGIFYIFKISKLIKHKSIYLPKSTYFKIKYDYVNIDTFDDLKSARNLSKNFKFY